MKTHLLLSLFLCCMTIYGYSQDKGYIAISIGPSFPNGDFGSKDLNNESAGLATPGAIFDITYARKFGKNLGLTLLLRGQANGTDTDPLLDALYEQDPSIPWQAESEAWRIGGLMGGLYGSFPMGEGKVTFETRAMIGYMSATSPEITISGIVGGQNFWVTTESATGGAFGYLVGAGFKFNLATRLCLLLNLDYLAATPEFEDVRTITSLGTFTEDTYQQNFGTVNVGVGLGWRW